MGLRQNPCYLESAATSCVTCRCNTQLYYFDWLSHQGILFSSIRISILFSLCSFFGLAEPSSANLAPWMGPRSSLWLVLVELGVTQTDVQTHTCLPSSSACMPGLGLTMASSICHLVLACDQRRNLLYFTQVLSGLSGVLGQLPRPTITTELSHSTEEARR